MRQGLVSLVVIMLAAGCGPSFEIRPESGAKVGSASAQGITIYADAEQWSGSPRDLPDYLTPIAVQIVNHSRRAMRITYGDFSLLDGRGFRYAAVNPYTGAASQPHRGQVDAPRSGLAAAEGGGAALSNGKPVVQQAPVYLPKRIVVAGPGPYLQPRGRLLGEARRFTVHVRGSYQPAQEEEEEGEEEEEPGELGGDFEPFFWPPDYDLWVYPWGYPYYQQRPSYDVQRLALPEGVVHAGGQVSGFVYFQNVGRESRSLQLVFNAYTPKGKHLTTLRIPFVVIRK